MPVYHQGTQYTKAYHQGTLYTKAFHQGVEYPLAPAGGGLARNAAALYAWLTAQATVLYAVHSTAGADFALETSQVEVYDVRPGQTPTGAQIAEHTTADYPLQQDRIRFQVVNGSNVKVFFNRSGSGIQSDYHGAESGSSGSYDIERLVHLFAFPGGGVVYQQVYSGNFTAVGGGFLTYTIPESSDITFGNAIMGDFAQAIGVTGRDFVLCVAPQSLRPYT